MSSAIVTALLAGIIFKRVYCDVSEVLGYNYPPPPLPPVQFDEPSTPSSGYLPPVFQDEVPVPLPTYLPPVFYPPLGTPPSDIFDDDTVVIPPPAPGMLYQSPTPQMKILNMSCVLDSSFKSNFRLEPRMSSLAPPVADNGVEGCVRSDSSGTTFSVDMEGKKKLSECGVRRCASATSPRASMCLPVRMPVVKGIKLPEDALVTLQCAPQDAVVSHTKHISLSPTTSNKGRSANSGVVASGGGQRNFDSKILLLRKSGKNGNFDRPLQPGSVVLLGEELILRAVVQDRDGWRFSRMGPVTVRSPSLQKSVTLVEENGCRSPGMRSICPHQPRLLSPLDTVLHFRAFLFQGSSKGEDMLLSVRMLGCMHSHDCYQNGPCSEENLAPPLRFKRDSENATFLQEKNGTSDWESQIKFRVQLPEKARKTMKNLSVSGEFLIVASTLTLCLIVVTVSATIYFKRKNTQ